MKLPSIDFLSGPGTSPAAARAQLTAFGTPDLINWTNLGVGTGNQLNFDPAHHSPPFVAHKSDKNKRILVTHPLDLTFFVGGSQGGWPGRFSVGDGLIFTNEVPPDNVDETWKESIIIHIPVGIRGVGVQFDIRPPKRPPGEPAASVDFTAHAVTRHRNWVDYLRTKAAGSIGPGSAAGSAVFVGLASPTPVTDYVTFEVWVTSRNGQQLDFAINQVTLIS